MSPQPDHGAHGYLKLFGCMLWTLDRRFKPRLLRLKTKLSSYRLFQPLLVAVSFGSWPHGWGRRYEFVPEGGSRLECRCSPGVDSHVQPRISSWRCDFPASAVTWMQRQAIVFDCSLLYSMTIFLPETTCFYRAWILPSLNVPELQKKEARSLRSHSSWRALSPTSLTSS